MAHIVVEKVWTEDNVDEMSLDDARDLLYSIYACTASITWLSNQASIKEVWACRRPDWWAFILSKVPELAKKCQVWDQFNGEDWVELITHQPQFVDRCDWTRLEGNDWTNLIRDNEGLAFYACEKGLPSYAWTWLVTLFPHLFCKRVDWSVIESRDWEDVLRCQPTFAVHCDFAKLEPIHLLRILERNPHLHTCCDLSVFDKAGREVLTEQYPWLEPFFPQAAL